MLTLFCVSETLWPCLTARICVSSLRLQFESRAASATAPPLYRTNWALAADIMCIVLPSSAAGLITLGVCYLTHCVLHSMLLDIVCPYGAYYLANSVPTWHVPWQCCFTACYLTHNVWFGTQCFLTQRIIWHTACYLTNSMLFVSVLFGTQCIHTPCSLAHCVFVQSVLFGT